jgi:hypothetical protein
MKLAIFFLSSITLYGQVVVVGDVPMPEARVVINNNFAYVDAKQQTGTTLPTNCKTGQIFTKTNATAGANTYVALATASPCTTWTLQGGVGAGPANAVQVTSGSGTLVDSGCTATGGQLTCPSGFVSTSASPTLITLNAGPTPATPATGKGAVYMDSATLTKGLSVKDDAGIIQRTVKPTACSGGTPVLGAINADGTVTCAVGGSSYDPTDVTVYSSIYQLLTLTEASPGQTPGAVWGITVQCSGGTPVQSTRAGMVAFAAMTANAGNPCNVFAPQSSFVAGVGIPDFISGSAPLTHKLKVYAQRDTSGGAGSYSVGWAKSIPGTTTWPDASTFVGIQDDGTNFRCVIIGPASAVVAAVTIAPVDTAEHWFTVDNGAAVPNSITCKVGAATATVTGAIPATTAWVADIVVTSISSSTPKFNMGEARIYIAGRQPN